MQKLLNMLLATEEIILNAIQSRTSDTDNNVSSISIDQKILKKQRDYHQAAVVCCSWMIIF
jgi:hypothetical protein